MPPIPDVPARPVDAARVAAFAAAGGVPVFALPGTLFPGSGVARGLPGEPGTPDGVPVCVDGTFDVGDCVFGAFGSVGDVFARLVGPPGRASGMAEFGYTARSGESPDAHPLDGTGGHLGDRMQGCPRGAP
ncbi:hypothetical protein [Nocardia brasiliensis]|uniref:hypothetical protein n=1 Tax=Nocardia brasiliensis TaxID=37326 RepID=UPI0024573CD4|nr:hypothetical protein [Nocardia brasiliensis]